MKGPRAQTTIRSFAVLGLALAGAPGAHGGGTAPALRKIECYCTDSSGSRVELEQEICLRVDGRAFIARCDMSLNVPTWRDTGRNCLSSGLLPRDLPRDLPRSLPASGSVQGLQPAGDAGLVHTKIRAPIA